MVDGPLAELDATIDELAEPGWVGTGGEKLPFQGGELPASGLGGGEVGLDARIAAAEIEVVETPAGGASGRETRGRSWRVGMLAFREPLGEGSDYVSSNCVIPGEVRRQPV